MTAAQKASYDALVQYNECLEPSTNILKEEYKGKSEFEYLDVVERKIKILCVRELDKAAKLLVVRPDFGDGDTEYQRLSTDDRLEYIKKSEIGGQSCRIVECIRM